MQRYFVNKEQFDGDQVIVSGDDARHIQKVMRSRVGQKVIICDGSGSEAIAEITELAGDQVMLNVVEERLCNAEPQTKVWIAQSLPKGDKMEQVIQKCTEIGAVRFLPFTSARTIVQYDQRKEAKRLERWRKIAKEAAEQAHRGMIPVIEQTRSWKQLLSLVADSSVSLLCYEQEQEMSLRDAVHQAWVEAEQREGAVLLMIGPEGGFEAHEVTEAMEAGAHVVSLGRRILRTETAAMVGLTALLYESGEI